MTSTEDEAGGTAVAPPTPDTPPAPEHHLPPPKRQRWRKRAVLALVVMTCIGILASSIAVYAHRTLFDTDAWVEAVGPLASDPAVQEAVADTLTAQITQLVDAPQLLQEALPDRAQFLATPLSTAFEQFVHRAVLELLQTEQFQRLWVEANRYAHQIAVNVLRGETKGITTADGVVAVNLLPVLVRALNFVEQKAPGVLKGKTIPDDITFATPPDQARDELSAALGRTLPPEFGVVTLFQSDQLAAAQRAVVLIDRAVNALLIVTLLLGVGAMLLSVKRLRTLVQLGVGTVMAIALASAGIRAVREQIIELIGTPDTRAAAASALNQMFSSFRTLERTLLLVGLVVALVAFLAGESRVAVAVRRLAGRAAHRTGSTVSTGVQSGLASQKVDVPVVPAVADHKSAFQAAGVAVVAVGLLVFDITWFRLGVAVVLLAGYELAVTVLADAVGHQAVDGEPSSD